MQNVSLWDLPQALCLISMISINFAIELNPMLSVYFCCYRIAHNINFTKASGDTPFASLIVLKLK